LTVVLVNLRLTIILVNLRLTIVMVFQRLTLIFHYLLNREKINLRTWRNSWKNQVIWCCPLSWTTKKNTEKWSPVTSSIYKSFLLSRFLKFSIVEKTLMTEKWWNMKLLTRLKRDWLQNINKWSKPCRLMTQDCSMITDTSHRS